MNTYQLVDKNSDIIITCSGNSEEEAIDFVKKRVKCINTEFRLEEVEE